MKEKLIRTKQLILMNFYPNLRSLENIYNGSVLQFWFLLTISFINRFVVFYFVNLHVLGVRRLRVGSLWLMWYPVHFDCLITI